MRIGLAVSSSKFTGAAAVADHWCRALLTASCEVRLLFVAGANLERRIGSQSWALPHLVKDRRPRDVLANLRALRRLADASDVVITFLPHDHFEAIIAGVHRQVPLVRAFRNPRHLRSDPLHAWAARRCTGALAPFGGLSKRTRILVCGRPTSSIPVPVEDRFGPTSPPGSARETLGMDHSTPVIGMVGKMARNRGFDVLLEAAHRTRNPCRVLAVGHGEEQPILKDRAHALGIADRITWAGKREEDLPLLFAAMDAVVFAAPGSDWGHRVVSEAQACGRPVIARPVPGIADLLDHNRSGLVAGDAQEIADAFDRLIDDPELAQRLGNGGAEAAADRRMVPVGKRLVSFLEGMQEKSRFTNRGAERLSF